MITGEKREFALRPADILDMSINELIHWSREDVAVILKVKFSNSLYSKVAWAVGIHGEIAVS